MENPKEGWEIGKEAEPEIKPEVKPQAAVLVKKASHPPLQLIFFIALGFSLAAAGFAFFSKSVTKTNLPKRSPKTAVLPVAIVEVVTPAAVKTTEKTPSEPQRPIPTLTLSGILFGESGSFALINGRVIPEGGKVDGAVVDKISTDRVELSFEGRKITLRSR
jgi:type II secretory pathway component PulC